MQPLFNIHTHHALGQAFVTEIENVRFGQKPSGITPYCSAGLHPWFLEANTWEAAQRWLEAQSALPNVVAVGEAGLDKVCDTSLELQEKAFRYCIETSESVQKPLIIHCVKAYNEVIQIKTEFKPTQPWIFHGFNKHPDTARMLVDAGCFLSFGKALLQAGNHSAEALRQVPAERFFLETDDAEDLAIERIYERAAEIRGISLEKLVDVVEQNVRSSFSFT